ncbi:MAG: hypothetical protein QCI00_04250 [Candidatus Thermoplasmatota archaeon]|nr:hypothetical protein [Candidatus Thermoplasmatota archaeon]
MKTKTLVFLIVFSFLMVGFSGCEELEESDPNYIVTTVTANINSEYFITETEGYPNVGVNVRVQIIKAGGERIDEIVSTDSNGWTSATATFKVYKEQPIEIIANLVDYPSVHDSDKITWEEIKINTPYSKTGRTASMAKYLYLLTDEDISQ